MSTSHLITLPSWGALTTINATGTSANVETPDGYQIIVTSPSNTEVKVTKPLGDNRISPRLYFKYVKSKLKKHEVKNLKLRLTKLQVLTRDAFEIGQQALYEEYAKMITILVRESEAAVCGYELWLESKDINKYKQAKP